MIFICSIIAETLVYLLMTFLLKINAEKKISYQLARINFEKNFTLQEKECQRVTRHTITNPDIYLY